MSISDIFKINNLFYQPSLRGISQLDAKIASLQARIQRGESDPVVQAITHRLLANHNPALDKSQPRFNHTLYQIQKELCILCGERGGDENGTLDRAWRAYQCGIASIEGYQNLEDRRKFLDEEQNQLEHTLSTLLPSEVEQYVKNELQVALEDLTSQRSFEADLQSWCDRSPPGENRIAAAYKMRQCYFEKLETLSLSNLSSLPKAIGQLTELKCLDLRRIRELPAEIGQLIQLRELKVIGAQTVFQPRTKLTTLPSEIGKLINLQLLLLCGNQIENLPAEIGQLVNLKNFDVSNNQIENLSASIGQLTELQCLNASNNKIENLPTEIGQLKKLHSLSLCNNKIRNLFAEISQLTNLEHLDAIGNHISDLPASIGRLTNLRTLLVGFNQIENLPAEIDRLTRLTDLFVQGNQIQSIPRAVACLGGHCSMNIDQNPLTQQALQAFQEEVAEQRALEAAIAFWLGQLQSAFPIDHPAWVKIAGGTISDVALRENLLYQPLFAELCLDTADSRNNTQNFITFLTKLQGTKDFSSPHTRPRLVLSAALMLNGICSHAEFLRQCLAIIVEALGECEDRLALSFNQIEVQWQLFCDLEVVSDPGKLAHLLIGVKRKELLCEFAEKIILAKGLGDGVEPHLYLQVHLKDALKLPVSTQGMLYPRTAQISGQEVAQAKNYVLDKTSSLEQIVQILTSSKFWQDRIKEEHKEEFDKINGKFSGEITEIFEDESLIQSEQMRRIGELSSEQKNQTDRLVLELTEQVAQGTLLALASGNATY